uniref:Uncharacterized protein n=1 Tax=Oryza nivara TaxID=4536 RepID=A0A0E0HW81_ORYNI
MQLQKEGDRRLVENGIKVNRSLAIRLVIDELELVVGYTIKLALIEMGQCRMDSAPTAAANRRVHEIAYRFRDADKADGEEIDSSMLCGLEFLFSNNWRPIRFTETVAYAPNYACSFSHLLQQVTKHALSERWLIGAAALTMYTRLCTLVLSCISSVPKQTDSDIS